MPISSSRMQRAYGAIVEINTTDWVYLGPDRSSRPQMQAHNAAAWMCLSGLSRSLESGKMHARRPKKLVRRMARIDLVLPVLFLSLVDLAGAEGDSSIVDSAYSRYSYIARTRPQYYGRLELQCAPF